MTDIPVKNRIEWPPDDTQLGVEKQIRAQKRKRKSCINDLPYYFPENPNTKIHTPNRLTGSGTISTEGDEYTKQRRAQELGLSDFTCLPSVWFKRHS